MSYMFFPGVRAPLAKVVLKVSHSVDGKGQIKRDSIRIKHGVSIITATDWCALKVPLYFRSKFFQQVCKRIESNELALCKEIAETRQPIRGGRERPSVCRDF